MWLYLIAFLLVSFYFLRRFYLETFFVDNLQEKAVFITGCDTGFGHEFAIKLVRNGIRAYAGCYTKQGETALQNAVKDVKGWQQLLTTLNVDVTNQDTLKTAADTIAKSDKKLWAIVCNAGIAEAIAPDDWLTIDDYQKTLDVNLLGVIRTCHEFKPLLKRNKGRIIIVASVAGRITPQYFNNYCVSKHGVEAYADGLRSEIRPWKVGVHIVEPGFFTTSITNNEHHRNLAMKRYNQLPENTRLEYGEKYVEKFVSCLRFMLEKCCSTETWRVVDAYYHAAFGWWPRNRYLVGWDAIFAWGPISVLPDFIQDISLDIFLRIMGQPTPACKTI